MPTHPLWLKPPMAPRFQGFETLRSGNVAPQANIVYGIGACNVSGCMEECVVIPAVIMLHDSNNSDCGNV